MSELEELSVSWRRATHELEELPEPEKLPELEEVLELGELSVSWRSRP